MKRLSSTLLSLALCLAVFGQTPLQFQIPNLSIRLIEGADTLQNAWAGGLNAPLISEIDVNFDGIKDLFMHDRSNNRISVFLNDGSTGGNPYHYDYASPLLFPPVNSWALLFDYDCDGKEDFFTLSPCNCGIEIHRNTSTSNQLQFTLITNMLEEQYFTSIVNVYANAVAIPAFSDIDDDGDMDILGYNSLPNGRIYYHRNYSIENYLVCDSLNFKFESNNWGFFRLQTGGTNNVGCYTCRTADPGPQDPIQFNSLTGGMFYDQSLAAQRDDSNTSIFAIDLDGDLDKELLVGDITATNTLMVCNGGTPSVAFMDSLCTDTLFPAYDVSIGLRYFANHAYIDVDNDGTRDLLATPEHGENKECVWYYRNTGTNSVPVFDYTSNSFIVQDMLDVGEGASPVFFDYNSDGAADMVVGSYGDYNSATGNYERGLALYKNTGTPANPQFTLVSLDYSGVAATLLDGPLYPAFGDLTGDGIADMMLGAGDGALYYFLGSGNPVTFTLAQANFANIDVGNASTPVLADLSNDGKLDLVVGEQNGFLNYYENTGSVSSPSFSSTPTIDTLGGINVRTPSFVDGYSVPFIYKENGLYNLWVSCSMGDVYEYLDITNNLFGIFPINDTLVHLTQGDRGAYNLAASGTYIDSDAVIDMALGLYGGGVQFFTSINPTSVPPVTKISGFKLFPNPSSSVLTLKITSSLLKLPCKAEVYSSMGQWVRTEHITATSHTMDVSELASGLYFIKVISDKDAFVEKFFVSHTAR